MVRLLPVTFLSPLFLSLILSLLCTNGSPFSLDIIHRDSPHSPFYNPSLTPTQRRQAALRRSAFRVEYLRRATSTTNTPLESSTTIISNYNEHLAVLNLGTPPTKLFVIVDSGSDLIWTKCQPCTSCDKQITPVLDPAASSTYQNASCKSPFCSPLISASCAAGNTCQYKYAYFGGSWTKGLVATDALYLDGANSQSASITFGCSHENTPDFDAHVSGLLGLGGGPSSLVSQLGSSIGRKFSYCLVQLSSQTATGKLVFGDTSAVVGPDVVTTPMLPMDPDTFYYVSLETLVVNNVRIPAVGGGSHSKTLDLIVDSGTTMTCLSADLVQRLEKELISATNLPRATSAPYYNLCFESGSVTDPRLPSIVVQFAGGANVTLSSANAFDQADAGKVCLNIVAVEAGGSYVYGDVSQQNFLIGFDLVKREVSFAPRDCSKF